MTQTSETRATGAVVWAIIASQFAPPFMFAGVVVALPAMGDDLAAGATSLGLVETLFLAGSLSFLLPVGRLADASDKRTLFKLGLLSFSVTSLLIGLLSSVPVILCIRFLQGVTAAVCAATGPAILADIVPAERRGRAYGSMVGAVYAGLTLGPICAGLLIDVWGWRAVFLASAALLLAGYLLLRWMLPSKWRRPARSAVHLPSTVLVVAAVLCLVGGSAALRVGPAGYGLLAGGLALAALFVLLQRRLSRPLLDVGALMRQAVLRNALLVQMLIYMSAFSSIFMLSIYMQVSLGHPARLAGQVLASGSILMALASPVAGRLADRYPPGAVASFGVGGVLASVIIATALHQGSSLAIVVLVLAVQGLGFAFFSSPNMTTIMNSVSADTVSMASALGAKSRSLGMVSGMLIAAVLISLSIGNDPIAEHPARFIGIMVTAFTVLATLSAMALAVSLLARGRR